MQLSSIVIDCSNAERLMEFYQKLLNWEPRVYDHGEDGVWITLKSKDSTTRIVFQETSDYVRPTWPNKKNQQQIMLHMDFYSDDVEGDVKRALSLGAEYASYQSGDWRVLLDPEGHAFCIVPRRNR